MKSKIRHSSVIVIDLEDNKACCIPMQNALNDGSIVFEEGYFYLGSGVLLDDSIKFCPYCGAKIEIELVV